MSGRRERHHPVQARSRIYIWTSSSDVAQRMGNINTITRLLDGYACAATTWITTASRRLWSPSTGACRQEGGRSRRGRCRLDRDDGPRRPGALRRFLIGRAGENTYENLDRLQMRRSPSTAHLSAVPAPGGPVLTDVFPQLEGLVDIVVQSRTHRPDDAG